MNLSMIENILATGVKTVTLSASQMRSLVKMARKKTPKTDKVTRRLRLAMYREQMSAEHLARQLEKHRNHGQGGKNGR